MKITSLASKFANLFKRPAAKVAEQGHASPSGPNLQYQAPKPVDQKPLEQKSIEPEKPEPALQVLERFVVFKVGKLWLGLDIGEISEVVTDFSITPVPQVPQYVEGVMSLRGDMIPIVHLGARLDLEVTEKSEDTRIVVLKAPHVKVGFMVDEMKEIVKVENDLVIDIPQFISDIKIPHHFLKKATLYKEELLFILDAKEVLSKDAPKELYENMTGGHPERTHAWGSEGSPGVSRGKNVA